MTHYDTDIHWWTPLVTGRDDFVVSQCSGAWHGPICDWVAASEYTDMQIRLLGNGSLVLALIAVAVALFAVYSTYTAVCKLETSRG